MSRVIVDSEKFNTKSISTIGYLRKVKNQEISIGIATNREVGEGNWKKSYIDEFIRTLVCGYHTPAFYLCELKSDESWKTSLIMDGQHRTNFAVAFRFYNYRISKNFEHGLIRYYSIVRDEDGNPVRNEDGDIVYEIKEFDLRNKTFSDLPEELKENFDNSELTVVTAEDCTISQMSEYTIRYNNHTPFNAIQSSFATLFEIAKSVRRVSHHCFFKEILTPSNITKGHADKIAIQSLYLLKNGEEKWIKKIEQLTFAVKEETTEDDVNELYDVVDRMYDSIGDALDTDKRIKTLMKEKNTALFIYLFSEYEKLGKDPEKFIDVIYDILDNPTDEWTEMNAKTGTADKAVIVGKMKVLREYINKDTKEVKVDVLEDEGLEMDALGDIEITDDTTSIENEDIDIDTVSEILNDVDIIKNMNIKDMNKVINDTAMLLNKENPFSEENIDIIINCANKLDDIAFTTDDESAIYCESNLPALLYIMDVLENSELDDVVTERWFGKYVADYEEDDATAGMEENLNMMVVSFAMFEKFQKKTA